MTVRTPLKLDAVTTDLRQMTTAEVAADVKHAAYLYGGDPSITLSVANSGGNINSMSDTRLQAGASTTDITNFDTEAETGNVSTITTTYARIIETRDTAAGDTTDTDNVRFPIYYDDTTNTIQAMSLTDFRDTFIKPAVDILTNTSDAYGKYRIHASTVFLANHTCVSTTPVFIDTRANAGAYTAAGIGETRDQPTTVTEYFLFRGNAPLNWPLDDPTSNVMFAESTGNLGAFSAANWDALLLTDTRYVARQLSGSSLHYSLGTSTAGKRGTGMTDTRLNSSTYNQRLVNVNDYRTQEFPAGSAVSQSTKYLRLLQY